MIPVLDDSLESPSVDFFERSNWILQINIPFVSFALVAVVITVNEGQHVSGVVDVNIRNIDKKVNSGIIKWLPAGNNKQFNMRSFRRKSSRRWQIAQSWGVTFPWTWQAKSKGEFQKNKVITSGICDIIFTDWHTVHLYSSTHCFLIWLTFFTFSLTHQPPFSFILSNNNFPFKHWASSNNSIIQEGRGVGRHRTRIDPYNCKIRMQKSTNELKQKHHYF